MSNKIIRAAIEGRLQEWAALQTPPIPVIFQNMGAKPVVGQRYLRGFLMPAETLNPSEGSRHKYYHGLYQVSIYEVENQGAGDSDELAEAIEVLFASPTTISKGGLNVLIQQTPAIGSSRPDDAGFFMTPVTIKYSANDFS